MLIKSHIKATVLWYVFWSSPRANMSESARQDAASDLHNRAGNSWVTFFIRLLFVLLFWKTLLYKLINLSSMFLTGDKTCNSGKQHLSHALRPVPSQCWQITSLIFLVKNKAQKAVQLQPYWSIANFGDRSAPSHFESQTIFKVKH